MSASSTESEWRISLFQLRGSQARTGQASNSTATVDSSEVSSGPGWQQSEATFNFHSSDSFSFSTSRTGAVAGSLSKSCQIILVKIFTCSGPFWASFKNKED